MVNDGGPLRSPISGEVDELKRAWYNHVLTTLQKLDDRVDSISSELYKELYRVKEAIQKDLYSLKSELEKEIASTKTFSVEAMEKIQNKINELIEKLSSRIEVLEKSVVKEELVKELNNIKQNLTKDILNQKTAFVADIAKQKEEFNKLLEPINTKITKIEVKLALWAAGFGVIGGIILKILLFLADKYYFKG